MNKILKEIPMAYLLPFLGLAAGFFMAQFFTLSITEELSVYLAIALVVTFDMLLESVKQFSDGRFNVKGACFNYVFNLLVAAFFVKIGYLVRIDLYIALFIIFGMKLFSNLAYISQKFFSKPSL